MTELAGEEGSIPAISSPRRSNLAFVRVGSAVCGNSELKVRHKYGAKRVFKLMIRADFSPSVCCLFFFFLSRGVGGRGLAREDPPVHLCRAVCTYTAPGRGVEARQGTGASEEDEEERALCFIFEGRGRCETGLQSLLTHRLEIKQTLFSFSLFLFLFKSSLLLLLLLPCGWHRRGKQSDFDTTFGAAFCKMRHAFL